LVLYIRVAMNLDNITLDNICESLGKQKNSFDLKALDEKYHKMFPDKLAKYVLVSPYDVKTIVTVGDKIRYIKKGSGEISCVASVAKIIKTGVDGKDYYFVLSLVVDRTSFWTIYPSECFIFQHNRFISDDDVVRHLSEKLIENGKSVKNFNIPQKERHKILEQMGATKTQIKKEKYADEMIKEGVAKAPYTKGSVSENNIDEMLDDIFAFEEKKRKNRKKLF
ncbi:hypothetical protein YASMINEVIRUS_2, partial [Yasminevirus sp. GU-2018]